MTWLGTLRAVLKVRMPLRGRREALDERPRLLLGSFRLEVTVSDCPIVDTFSNGVFSQCAAETMAFNPSGRGFSIDEDAGRK